MLLAKLKHLLCLCDQIESLLQRNHSPRKFATEHAYRLQQGFLSSSTQEVVVMPAEYLLWYLSGCSARWHLCTVRKLPIFAKYYSAGWKMWKCIGVKNDNWCMQNTSLFRVSIRIYARVRLRVIELAVELELGFGLVWCSCSRTFCILYFLHKIACNN